MLIFRIPVTISELALTLALSGDPSMSPQKQLQPCVALGAVDFLLMFGIRNKSKKNNTELRTQFSVFYSGFHSRRLSPPRLRNFTQSEPQRNCQYDSPKMTIVRPPA